MGTSQWPGVPNPNSPAYASYSEKLLVGYRYYDHHKIAFTTGFPFGHGLSYTTFKYSSLAVEVHGCDVTASFVLANTGKVAGAEVAQVYVEFPASAGEPPKVLRRFSKVTLSPGKSSTVHVSLASSDTSIWSVKHHSWQQVHGKFSLLVGSSSRDIRLTAAMTLNATAC